MSGGKVLGFYLKGRLALARRQPDDAITLLQQAIQEEPTLSSAHYYLGLAHWQNRNPALARSAFAAASEIVPTAIDPHLALAEVSLQLRAFDQAIQKGRLSSSFSLITPGSISSSVWPPWARGTLRMLPLP